MFWLGGRFNIVKGTRAALILGGVGLGDVRSGWAVSVYLDSGHHQRRQRGGLVRPDVTSNDTPAVQRGGSSHILPVGTDDPARSVDPERGPSALDPSKPGSDF